METYGKILVIAMPIFVLLVLIEKCYGIIIGQDKTPNMDAISSLSSGITNAVKDVLGLSITIISYGWLVSHVAIFQLQANVWSYMIGFIAIDFYGYWGHRWAHQINFLWNKHAIHHSSEEFNLPCALRQSVSSWVNLFTFLLLPAAFLGVPAGVIAVIMPLHLFAQFWYHTRHIGKLGFLENIIVTPSHHRVHHAINPIYIDKNHGQIFIIWDKLFGTFQAELPEAPPVYGITVPAQTWNPIKINYQHMWLMITDAWRANDWKDKFRIWWKPTGWRPADVAARYPVYKIEDVYNFEKYRYNNPTDLVIWAVIQLLVTFASVSFFFGNIGSIGSPHIFVYGAFVILTVYSYTDLMDRSQYSLLWEAIRLFFGIYILNNYGDWFGLNKFIWWGNYLVIGYLVISFLVNLYFVVTQFSKDDVASKIKLS